MKNCDEMVNSLLERRDRYVAEQKRKRKIIIRTATSMCCVCLVALLGFGMWQGGMFNTTQSETLNDNADTQTFKNDADLSNKSSVTANDNVGNYPNNYIPNGSEKTMISSFSINGTQSASYATPENGKVYFSIPLREAMNEYGDSVLYRVVVDVFNNREQLSSDSSQVQDECERLSDIGYVVAYETVFDGESYHYYFTLHATYDELTEFIAKESYGYFMFLYDERVESNVE
ncbi:MAG: hypothetical protein PUB20_01090 [Clostridia bacterium]|nr:hypothetical protein [Clostridia bacterium]